MDAIEFKTVRVLVVDDNPAIHGDFRKILDVDPRSCDGLEALHSELFETPGAPTPRSAFEIGTASQCDEAVAVLGRALEERRPYAVAFVDMRMPPGRNGIETIQQLWELDRDLQVVICTAYADCSWEDVVQRLGQSDGLLVLKKPFDAIEVLQMAHALSQKWLLARRLRREMRDLEDAVRSRTRELQDAVDRLQQEIEHRTTCEADLRKLATHDTLTGLPNRLLLRDRLNGAIARARRHGSCLALMLLDLDHFKDVNDAYGHDAGDSLLVAMGQRLLGAVRASDTVARMGGDEFVVLAEEVDRPEDAALVAQRVIDACAMPLVVAGHEVQTPPSVGIATFPGDGTDAEALLKAADLAMYRAKESGRGGTFRFYATDMLTTSAGRAEVREQLRRAVDRGEFELWYQPVLELGTGRVSSAEALIRWRHPTLGLVSPLQFIPIAEKTGLIVPIGAWVLQTACKQLRRWRDEHDSDLAVAVNVSARQIQERAFVDTVLATLDETGVPPTALHLEITESSAMENLDGSREAFEQLAKAGVRIVIDDFGSGYSSLDRLKQLPIHSLKIDRLFVKDIVHDPRDAAIVRAIVAMAHSLGLTVVAEGVETAEQLERLKELDRHEDSVPLCDHVQGYLLSRPLPAERLAAVLGEHVASASERRTAIDPDRVPRRVAGVHCHSQAPQ